MDGKIKRLIHNYLGGGIIPFFNVYGDNRTALVKKVDVFVSNILFGSSPLEYYLFNFRGKSYKERSKFLSDHSRNVLLRKNDASEEELSDKYYFYTKCKDFFNRSMIKIESEADFESFKTFVLENPVVFIKPISSCCDIGASKISVADENSIKAVFDKIILAKETYIVETYISQSDKMSKWNRDSVNTVRIPAFNSEGRITVLQPFFRTGRKGYIVDNGGAGGIFTVVNEKTGELLYDATDEKGNVYEYHPDSGLKYKGTILPEWDKLMELVKKVHLECMPNHKYIGWDAAHTDNGWIIIEGNWGQMLGQIPSGKGIKAEFKRLLTSK